MANASHNQKPSILQVACYFLYIVDRGMGDVLTNLRVQKLCYFAQAVKLSRGDNSALFDENFEAWAYGPVCRSLYNKFRRFGWQAIDVEAFRHVRVDKLPRQDMELLDKVWDRLGHFSGRELTDISHGHAPWRTARGNLPPEVRCHNEISVPTMHSYYACSKEGKAFADSILSAKA